MSLMSALLQTYDFALEQGLVDNPQLGINGLTILPLYHSNKRSTGEDIFELTVGINGKAVEGRFLPKDERVVFPITEDSITRSGAKIAPHAICDELSYLSAEIDVLKNEEYHRRLDELIAYAQEDYCESFNRISAYLKGGTVREDFLKFYIQERSYTIDEGASVLSVEIAGKDGKAEKKSLDLKKVFLTFKTESEKGDLAISDDTKLHQFYSRYVSKQNSIKELTYCDITGRLDYCVERHRGIIGNAKLISISNNDETYYGRLKSGSDIYHISYEASQKIHNMLKYLLENRNHASYLGEGAYVVNWLVNEVDKGGIELLANLQHKNNTNQEEGSIAIENAEDIDDIDDDNEEPVEASMEALGGEVSHSLKEYFLGIDGLLEAKGDFYVLIVEKISNGRVSIKHFMQTSRSTAYERLCGWYETTKWKIMQNQKSPALYQMIDFLYGQENKDGKLKCENSKLRRSQMERLIPCLIGGKRIPSDVVKQAANKLSRRQSYKTRWNSAVYIGCALIKKHKADNCGELINAEKIEEVTSLKKSISFYYGMLTAVYEKLEVDAVRMRDGDNESDASEEKGERNEKGKKKKFTRVTNMDRLYSTMIRMPERTVFILRRRINPYIIMLKKKRPERYVFYDRLITEINSVILDLKQTEGYEGGALNEDFYLGYYYQKNEFYTKKNVASKELTDNDNEEIAPSGV